MFDSDHHIICGVEHITNDDSSSYVEGDVNGFLVCMHMWALNRGGMKEMQVIPEVFMTGVVAIICRISHCSYSFAFGTRRPWLYWPDSI